MNAGAAGIDRAKITGQRMAADFGEGSGEFDSRWASSYNYKVQGIVAFTRDSAAFRKFECQQNTTANFESVLNRLKAWSKRFPFLVAEIGVAGSGGDDKRIVRNVLVFRFNDAVLQIEACNFGHKHFDVRVMAKNRTDRCGDLSWREAGGSHLVKKRLEGVIVFSIDYRNADGRASQRFSGVKATEAGPYDHDAMRDWMCCSAVHFAVVLPFSLLLYKIQRDGNGLQKF
jgi:hypothetical protein